MFRELKCVKFLLFIYFSLMRNNDWPFTRCVYSRFQKSDTRCGKKGDEKMWENEKTWVKRRGGIKTASGCAYRGGGNVERKRRDCCASIGEDRPRLNKQLTKEQLCARWSCLRTGYRFTEIEVLPHGRAQESGRHDRRLVRRIVPLVHGIIVVVVVLVGIEGLRPLWHFAAPTATRTACKSNFSCKTLMMYEWQAWNSARSKEERGIKYYLAR